MFSAARQKPRRLFFGLAAGLLLSAVTHSTAGEPVFVFSDSSEWTLSPQRITENSSSALQVSHPRYTCAASFEHMQVTVQDGSIRLGFTSTSNPAIRCAEPVNPIGPRFNLPPLKPGSYPVWITDAPACVWTQGCKIGVIEEWAGELTVGQNTNPLDFTFRPTQAKVGSPFSLNLVSRDFGCGIVVSEKRVTIAEQTVTLHFKAAYDPAVACPTISTFSAPFSLPAMRQGTYKVVLDPAEGCPVELPLCDAYYLARTGQSLLIADSPSALGARPGAKRSGARMGIDKGSPAEVIWILPSGSSAVNAAGRHLP